MPDTRGFFDLTATGLTRRSALKGLAAGAGLMAAPGFVRYSQAQSSAPIRIGFQSHRTGIGATYAKFKAIEEPLYEKKKELGLLVKALGGKTGSPS